MNIYNQIDFMLFFMVFIEVTKPTKQRIIDEIPDITDDCKRRANDSVEKCSSVTCEEYNCMGKVMTAETFCKATWDGSCCLIGVFAHICSKDDMNSLEKYINNSANDLELKVCGQWPRKTFECL